MSPTIKIQGRGFASDPELKMFLANLGREYPDPNNEPLQPVIQGKTTLME